MITNINENTFARAFLICGLVTMLLGLVCCCFAGAGAAEDNLSVNETVSNISIPYRDSEQYIIDLEMYYQQFKSEQILDEKEMYGVLYDTLTDDTLTWEQKSEQNLAYMGWDFRLETYMDHPEKYTVNEETGVITWDLGIGNWWANLFGAGINELELPQNIAEGDALYKVYCDNFNLYVDALHAAGDP